MSGRHPTLAFEAPRTSEATPVATLEALRRALRAGDAEAVAARLETERRADEYDLLSALVDEVGPDRAVRQMQRFWKAADARTVLERTVSRDEVEVYEDIHLPSEAPRSSVTLLRRREHRWRVVATQDAPSIRPRMLVYCSAGAPLIDDETFTLRWMEAHGPTAELFRDGAEGVLSNPLEGWVGSIRGPVKTNQRASEIPGLADAMIEVSVEPSDDAATRGRQLVWVARAALLVADFLGAKHLGVPGAERLIEAEQVAQTLGNHEYPPIHVIATTWVKLHRETHDGFASTRGMSHFMKPEIEYALSDFEEVEDMDQVALSVASAAIGGRVTPIPGTVVRLGGVRCVLGESRRGPATGITYGPWGAVRLLPGERGLPQSGAQVRITGP